MIGFERVFITNMGQWNEPSPPVNYMVSVSGISGVAEVQINASMPFNGSSILPVTLSAVSLAAGALRLNSRAIITLQSDVTFGTINHTSGVPLPSQPADDAQSSSYGLVTIFSIPPKEAQPASCLAMLVTTLLPAALATTALKAGQEEIFSMAESALI
jgi:hypothetical protein